MLLVAGLGRWFFEYPLSTPFEFFGVTGVAVLTVFMAAMAAPATREWAMQQIKNRKIGFES